MITLAATERGAGRPAKALSILRQALELAPDNHPLTMRYAEALLEDGQTIEATALLERHLPGHLDDAGLYKLLSRAAGASGRESDGHQYLAEYHYQNGRLKQAAEHLELASKVKDIGLYQREALAARLKQVKEEIEALEEKDQ